MSNLFICSNRDGGCGFVGHDDEFPDGTRDGPYKVCPMCQMETTCAPLDDGTFKDLVDTSNEALAAYLLAYPTKDDAPMAQCNCVHHAEQGIPCKHDVALVRKMFQSGELRS